MGSRGRKSLAALMTGPAEPIGVPEPYDLPDAEAEEWRAIVKARPPEFFSRSDYSLLSQLCRHIVEARRVAQLIERCVKAKNFNREDYLEYLRAQAAESASIVRLSRSLRLSPQSRTDRQSPKLRPTATETNPWDRE